MDTVADRKAQIEQQVEDVHRELVRQSSTWNGHGNKLAIRSVLYALSVLGWTISRNEK